MQHATLVALAGGARLRRYVPSIGHFILQQQALLAGGGLLPPLRRSRSLPPRLLRGGRAPELLEAPRFQLRGLAIGNGLTAPEAQVGAGRGREGGRTPQRARGRVPEFLQSAPEA